MNFKYKHWSVEVNKNDMYHFVWSAYNDINGHVLEDREGGELGNMANAKIQIKEWIDEYEHHPVWFTNNRPELVRKGIYNDYYNRFKINIKNDRM